MDRGLMDRGWEVKMARYEVCAEDELRAAVGDAAAKRLSRAVGGKLKLSPGRLARLAEGLRVMSEDAKERSRSDVVLDQGRAIDAGVVFGWRAGYAREVPDTKAMRILLPRETNPHLYSDTSVEGAVTVSVGPPPQDG